MYPNTVSPCIEDEEMWSNVDKVIGDVSSGVFSESNENMEISKEIMDLVEQNDDEQSEVLKLNEKTSLNEDDRSSELHNTSNVKMNKPTLILSKTFSDELPGISSYRRRKKTSSKFPERLFKIVNDDILIKWSDDGLAFVIEKFKDFGERVNTLYPGFLHVPTFHNFRRMLRDYGFEFSIIRRQKPLSHMLEYSHSHSLFTKESSIEDFRNICDMKRDRQEYLRMVRRQDPSPHRRRFPGENSGRSNKIFQSKVRDSGGPSFVSNEDSLNSSLNSTNEQHPVVEQLVPKPPIPVRSNDSLRLLQLFGRNELDEVDFAELMLRQLRNCDDRHVSQGAWEATLEKVNSLVFEELPPSLGSYSENLSQSKRIPFYKL